MNRVSNGRIDIQSPDTRSLFNMYDKIPAHQCTTYRNPLEGQWDDSTLSKAYFSKENIQIIQNGIRAGVYKQSNNQYVVAPQDCDSLKIVMRSIYLQYSANLPGNISGQIEALNQMVLNFCIQQVYSEAKGYMKYLSDASNMYVPIAHPVLAKDDDKELILKPWF
jgi:Family of unknown function (DUF5761)